MRRHSKPRHSHWAMAPIRGSVDVTREETVAAAFAASAAAMTRIDALVCSAGITGPNTTVEQYPLAAWKDVIDINLTPLPYATGPSSRT